VFVPTSTSGLSDICDACQRTNACYKPASVAAVSQPGTGIPSRLQKYGRYSRCSSEQREQTNWRGSHEFDRTDWQSFQQRAYLVRSPRCFAVTGAALLARALAGHCGVKAALSGHTSLGEGLRDQWRHIRPQRSHIRHGLPGSPMHAAKSEAVDTAVEESFPASDPPASRLPDDPPVNAEAKWEATRAAESGQQSGDGRSTSGPRA
jgi:hypothetical protein